MAEQVYATIWVYQEGEYVNASVRLTQAHADGSQENIVCPLRITAQPDYEDPEAWVRQALAEVIERL